MREWFGGIDVEAVVVVLACCLLVWLRFTTDRWRHRFRSMSSPLVKAPAQRALFFLVLIGALLVSTLPEAAFVLPALDVIGLDVVTLLVALELRHYLASVARLVTIPTNTASYLRAPGHVVRRCGELLKTHPGLWLYACMWPVIWIRTLKGTMP